MKSKIKIEVRILSEFFFFVPEIIFFTESRLTLLFLCPDIKQDLTILFVDIDMHSLSGLLIKVKGGENNVFF